MIKPAQNVESTVRTQLESYVKTAIFLAFFKEQSKHFPTIGPKDLRVDFDCCKAHIKNTLIKIASRHWLIQHNNVNRPFSCNLRFYAKITIFTYFS